jgi:anti-sigma factor RsiW
MNEFDPRNACQLEDVAAYLDGELSGDALICFEDHLKSCAHCDGELREQRQLLCTLESAFSDSRAFDLPNNFTRVVTARAENDLSGVRNRREGRRALQLCAALALVSFALLGAATRVVVWDPLRSFFRVTRALLDLAWQTTSEALSTALVLLRVIGQAIFPAKNGLGVFLSLVFLVSVSFLLFLITKYHRAEIVE